MAGQIESWFVRQDHPRRDRHRPCRARNADRAFMHGQITADAMAGAVIIIQPRLPQGGACEGIDMRPANAVRKHQPRQGDMTLHHPRDPIADCRRGGARAGPDGAGDIGGAVWILRTGVDQIHLIRCDAAVGCRAHPVMDDGAVRSGARNRRKTFAAKIFYFLPQGQQLRGGGDFGGGSCRPDLRQEMQKPAHCHRIAQMRSARALLLHGVLGGFRQGAGVWPIHHLGPRGAQTGGEPDRGEDFVHPHGLARQPRQSRAEISARGNGNPIAQPDPGCIRQLGRVHEQLHPRIGMHQREAQREGGKRHIGAANIQQPGQGCRIGQHRRILPGGAQGGGHCLALLHGWLPGIRQRMWHCRGQRRRGALGPDRIHRVCIRGAHLQPGFGVTGERILTDQQRVIADARALAGMLGQPNGGRRFGHMAALPDIGIGLLRQLEDIAPIRKHRRLRRQYRRQPGGAGETGEKMQPFGGIRHIFAQMLIGAGDDEAIQILLGQHGTQGGQAAGGSMHRWIPCGRSRPFTPLARMVCSRCSAGTGQLQASGAKNGLCCTAPMSICA